MNLMQRATWRPTPVRRTGPAITPTVRGPLLQADRMLASGLAAAVLSGLVLAWRGRAETGSAAAPINAPSQWLHGREALRRDDLTWRHTALGALVHGASSLLWAGLYGLLREQRERRGSTSTAAALADAAAVTAVAAVVDLKLVPDRLSPGFQHRLSRPAVALTYVSFAAGLLLAHRLRR
jgi:hypothetical protein